MSNTIVGYGKYRYKSGQEGDWFLTGFSPRKANMSLHVMMAQKNYADLLEKLGPHKTGVGCLYLKNLEDIHMPTLKKLIKKGFEDMKRTYTQ